VRRRANLYIYIYLWSSCPRWSTHPSRACHDDREERPHVDPLTGQVTAFVPGHTIADQPLGLADEGIVMAADHTLYAGEVVLYGMTKCTVR
jgi:hypothetical protein